MIAAICQFLTDEKPKLQSDPFPEQRDLLLRTTASFSSD